MYEVLVYVILVLLSLLLFAIEWKHKVLPKTASNADFRSFQKKYLTVYLGALLADWLQGPYLYRLYDHYGYLQSQIAALYIVGYLTAMLSGPMLGGVADRQGRKKLCIMFCGIYSLSCMCAFVPNFFVLLLGRALSGVSTSLLLSTFETWMVFEHNRHGFPSEWLPRTFALSTFGNGVIAVVAGIIANWVADSNKGYHPSRPFGFAIMVLIVTSWLLHTTWEENVAPEDALVDPAEKLAGALRPILRNRKIWLLLIVQTFFESAMYTFVFLWTPSLAEHHYHAPLGYIFASFMLAIICGSTIFQMALANEYTVAKCLDYSIVLSAGSFIFCFLFDESTSFLYLSFVVFELACGIYYPAVASLRGEILPEEHRGGIMGWFRVPLNILIVFLLFATYVLSHHALFALCAVLCVLALIAHRQLEKMLIAESAAQDEEAGESSFVNELHSSTTPKQPTEELENRQGNVAVETPPAEDDQ